MRDALGIREALVLVLLAGFVIVSGSGAMIAGWPGQLALFVLPLAIASAAAYGLYRIGRRIRPKDDESAVPHDDS